MVYYRKYRPQKIKELDSQDVRDRLTSALSSKSVSHAFLFTGPKGLGKTSAARIVAKAVNCEENSKLKGQKSKLQLKTQNLRSEETKDLVEPCNKCYQCISVTSGTNIDVLEIDGASNRGIDEIRDLREKVKLSPFKSQKKVYIIDEVHMLTQEAFNALLKTLEEPPPHVIFILCTTEPHKVPLTIISRCSHIPFKKATNEELVRSFKRIIKQEKIDIDNDALYLLASLSDGSFRDGAKILEEMAIFNQKITKELVGQKYQIRQLTDQISEMIEFLSKKDAKNGLQLVSTLIEQGVDFKYFIEQLISELHEILLAEVGTTEKSKMSIEEIKELIELLSRAYGELKYAVLPQLPLELAIIQWQAQKNAEQHAEQRGNEIQRSSAYNSALFSDKAVHVKSATSENEEIWDKLIKKVKSYNHSIAGVLRGCRLKSYDNKKIVIEAGYKFHKERLDEKKTREIIEKVCEELGGKSVAVSVILKIKN